MTRPFFFRPPQVDRYLTCGKKRKFDSEAQAQTANQGHRPYKCPYCDGWHLTSRRTK